MPKKVKTYYIKRELIGGFGPKGSPVVTLISNLGYVVLRIISLIALLRLSSFRKRFSVFHRLAVESVFSLSEVHCSSRLVLIATRSGGRCLSTQRTRSGYLLLSSSCETKYSANRGLSKFTAASTDGCNSGSMRGGSRGGLFD